MNFMNCGHCAQLVKELLTTANHSIFPLVLYVYCSFQAENVFLWARLMKLRLEHEVDHVRLA